MRPYGLLFAGSVKTSTILEVLEKKGRQFLLRIKLVGLFAEENMIATENQELVKVDVRVGERSENVILTFGQPISWLELDPVRAIKVSELMKEQAIEILRSPPI